LSVPQKALREGREKARAACRALESAVRPMAVASNVAELEAAYNSSLAQHVEAIRQYKDAMQHRMLRGGYHAKAEAVETALDDLQFSFLELLADAGTEQGAASAQ
tara:strand:- start:3114 stop:3428 length:315 start_codon:yes stop_codon:yes gene_type:complete